MRWCHSEPTIAELLSDPIVRALMAADRIAPEALEAKAWAELLALPLTITNLQTQQEAQAILKPFAEASAEGPAARSAAECHCSGPQGAPIRLIARIPPPLQTEVTPWNLFQGQAYFFPAKFG